MIDGAVGIVISLTGQLVAAAEGAGTRPSGDQRALPADRALGARDLGGDRGEAQGFGQDVLQRRIQGEIGGQRALTELEAASPAQEPELVYRNSADAPLDPDREVDTRVRIHFWARALTNADLSAQQDASFRSWIAATRALLKARKELGELDADLKAEPMAEVIVALIIGASVLSVFMPKRARRGFVRRIVATAMDALL